MHEENKKNWKEKSLHEEFNRQTEEIRTDESWRWLQNGFLNEKTKGVMLAAEEEVLIKVSIKFSIDKISDAT